MLDYHLHLWPHSKRETPMVLAQLAAYCERAQEKGVVEIALTEHLHRFTQLDDVVGKFWEGAPNEAHLEASMASYFDHHVQADLDAYVELCLEAKRQGLPVVMGMEVDYYRGQMDGVSELLAQYPFDVLLGSIHWIGIWQFDDVDGQVAMAEWKTRDVAACWDAYTEALEELAATKSCDVLAHPDLVKVAGYRPGAPTEWWDRIAEAASTSNMAAEVSSAGWRKPANELYPAPGLLERLVAKGVPLTTASDAHRLEHVADRAEDLHAILTAAGVTELQGYLERTPHAVQLRPTSGNNA
ncbi:MAG: histidinol-phosphatase [Actinomycetota bacterium]